MRRKPFRLTPENAHKLDVYRKELAYTEKIRQEEAAGKKETASLPENGYTEADLIAEKQPKQPPSPNARFSIQVIAYDEMPNTPGEVNFLPNLALQLRSLATATRRYREEGGDVSEIEALYNINNQPGDETLGNQRSLTLIEALHSNEDPTVAIGRFDWVNHDEHMKRFYTKLIQDIRKEMVSGMQVHAIDCTDGSFIAEAPNSTFPKLVDKNSAGNRGAHRRLLSEIAAERYKADHMSYGENDQYMIPSDGEVFFSANFFTKLNESIPKDAEDPIFVNPLYKFAADKTGDEGEAPNPEYTEWIRTHFYLRDIAYNLTFFSVDPKKGPKAAGYTAFPSTYIFNRSAYEQSSKWDISRHEGQDYHLTSNMTTLPNINYVQIPESITTQKDRLRSGAALGEIGMRQYQQGSKLTEGWDRIITTLQDESSSETIKNWQVDGPDFARFFVAAFKDKYGTQLTREERQALNQLDLENYARASDNTKDSGNLLALIKTVYMNRDTYPNLTEFCTHVNNLTNEFDTMPKITYATMVEKPLRES